MLTGAVAEVRHHPGLVDGQPVAHAVPEPGFHGRGVVGEGVCRPTYPPPALILEALREVPVEQGEERLYARVQQPVHEPVVEVQAGLVDRTPSLRHHPGPRHRESIGGQPQVLHDPDVVAPSVVVIAGNITGVAVEHPSGNPAETVPYALRPPVLGHRSLDLVGGRSRAPQETDREPPGHEPSTAPSRPSRARTPSTGPLTPGRVATSRVPSAGTRTDSSPKLRYTRTVSASARRR